jgi:hypothetical protein
MRALVLNYLPSTYSTAAIALSIACLLYIIVNKVLYRLSSPVRDLPGPKSVNWLTGSLPRSEWEPDSQRFQLDWAHQYGPVVKYYGWFNVSVMAFDIDRSSSSRVCQMTRVLTTDLQALNYILTAPEFEKPLEARRFLADVVGTGWLNFLDDVSV